MLAKVHSVTLSGIEAIECEVEVDISSRGFTGVNIVGLPDAAVKESIDRIKAALLNCGYHFPKHRTLVNLAPADIKKEGPAFDLPTALGILMADGQLVLELTKKYMILGELALDGRVRPVKGALSIALLAKEKGYQGVVVPRENVCEAAVVEDIEAVGVGNLTEAVGFLAGKLPLEPTRVDTEALFNQISQYELDFADVRGQEHAKRAMTIAAAGGHNLLMIGPPGSGKTMLAQRLPTILPPLSLDEALETTRIFSAVGLLKPGQALVGTRPVRTPHHSASPIALIGGSSNPQPGEVSLAHNGILFLDEMPEFQRSTLEMIRQPLEDGTVTISRVQSSMTFPARFILIAAMNPCVCGYFGHPRRRCRCTPNQVEKYVGKISGPLMDRIDIHLEVPAVDLDRMRAAGTGESSGTMREKVLRAREIQRQRFKNKPGMVNARMGPRLLRQHSQLDPMCEAILRSAVQELGLSARAHDKILRVARTIGDLEGTAQIQSQHVAEAINYRRLDRAG
jgi:magnesium chelatase family protein